MSKTFKYENMIKSLQENGNACEKPAMYQVILQYKEDNNQDIIKNLLKSIFHFSEEQVNEKISDLEISKQVVCGVYTKEIFDTKLSEMNKLMMDKKNPLDFIVKIK